MRRSMSVKADGRDVLGLRGRFVPRAHSRARVLAVRVLETWILRWTCNRGLEMTGDRAMKGLMLDGWSGSKWL